MSVVDLMQIGLWNLTGRTSWPPVWGAVAFWLAAAAAVAGYIWMWLVEAVGRLLAGSHPTVLPAEPVDLHPQVDGSTPHPTQHEQEAA